jgi:pyruvate, orthophosphate dikinase
LITESQRWVVPIAEADPDDVLRLGGKGASLATMVRLGSPVPPAFIVSTDLCRRYGQDGAIPADAWEEILTGLREIETAVGRRLDDSAAPLLVSVRSGAPVSMPGMMDTILNVGLGTETVAGLAAMTGDPAFAWDSYVRLLKMFAGSVRGMSAAALAAAAARARDRADGHEERLRLTAAAYLAAIESRSGARFPTDPLEQLRQSIEAVLRSWGSARARRYRAHAGIDEGLGTAVVVQAMVFGNLDDRSGSGVVFTRDPATGDRGLYGDFLFQAQGEDVVSGSSGVDPIDSLAAAMPEVAAALAESGTLFESAYRDMCDIEFTVESGKLWILQVRVGQRTAAAELRIALDLLGDGTISIEEALERVSPASLARPPLPRLEPEDGATALGRGIAVSPGAAIGALATTSKEAEARAADGEAVILVSEDTNPEDIGGFIASQGIVTARGGRASHAAVVARGMNRPAVCSVEGLEVGPEAATFGARTIAVGEVISIDGATGMVFAGAQPLDVPAQHPDVGRLLAAADERRRIPVLALEPAAWADDTIDPWDLKRTDEISVLRRLLAEEPGPIVIDPASSTEPAALLEAAAANAERVVIEVNEEWPAKLGRLPGGDWAGLLDTSDEGGAARLLAATLPF